MVFFLLAEIKGRKKQNDSYPCSADLKYNIRQVSPSSALPMVRTNCSSQKLSLFNFLLSVHGDWITISVIFH